MLIWAGEPEQALAIVQPNRHALVQLQLLEVEAYLQLKQHSAAQEVLQQALQLIDANSLENLRPQAQKLALHFGTPPGAEWTSPLRAETGPIVIPIVL